MNIRSVSQPVTPVDSQTKVESKAVKTDQSHQDRDADGRREQDEPRRDPLSEDELKKAKEYLENLEGLAHNNLTFEVKLSGDLKVFLIKDASGQVIRRIPEFEMRSLLSHKDEHSGHLFHRAG